MALNIKPFYPLEHPQEYLSKSDLIIRISRPSASAVYLKTEVKKEQTFERNEDIYFKYMKPKWRDIEHNLRDKTYKLLDVI